MSEVPLYQLRLPLSFHEPDKAANHIEPMNQKFVPFFFFEELGNKSIASFRIQEMADTYEPGQ